MTVKPLKSMSDDELERHKFHMQANIRDGVGEKVDAEKELQAIQRELTRREKKK